MIQMILLTMLSYGTWPMFGGAPEHNRIQAMSSAMEDSAVVKWGYPAGSQVSVFGPAIADVDGDGQAEVLGGSQGGVVFCLSGTTGAFEWSYPTSGAVLSAPAVADLDGDGDVEVVFGSLNDTLYCLSGATGLVAWKYATGNGIYSSPAIADVDGDGSLEVVVGSNDNSVYCIAYNGVVPFILWQFTTGGMVHSSPAIADLDDDGSLEVIACSFDTRVYCLSAANGALKWQYPTGGMIYSSPAVANLDYDAALEVVVGSFDDTVYCFSPSGSVEWRYGTGGDVWSSPAIGEAGNYNGVLEVFVGSDDDYLYCLEGSTGGMLWQYDIGGDIHRGPTLCDVTGDGFPEIFVPTETGSSLACLTGYGSLVWQKPLALTINDVSAGDVDGDGFAELALGTVGDSTLWVLDDPANSALLERGNSSGITIRLVGQNLLLFLPGQAHISLTLYDASGRLVQNLYDGLLGRGSHTFIPRLDNRGVYLAVLRYPGGTITTKLLR